jgi:hypothetical protein
MNIQIPLARLIAAFVIGVGWVITSMIAVFGVPYFMNEFGSIFLVGLFVFGCAATYGILSVLHGIESSSQQNRVDRMLSQLDENDLEVLRRRLGARNRYDEGEDGEYESLEALLDQQKRKRR